MNGDRDNMVHELANAYINDPFFVQPIAYQFETAVAQFEKLSDEELAKRYKGLKEIDHMLPAEDHDIIWSGQDGTDDEVLHIHQPEEFHF